MMVCLCRFTGCNQRATWWGGAGRTLGRGRLCLSAVGFGVHATSVLPLTNAVRIENRSEERSLDFKRRRPIEASEDSGRPARPLAPSPTCLRMFCSLISFCRSLLGLEKTTSRTSCPELVPPVTK